MSPAAASQPATSKIQAMTSQLQTALASVVQAQPETLRLVVVCLLCRGHLLLEDAPGLGKTTLAKALSKALALRMKRIQCTPDLMPSDITGISVYNSEEHQFHFMPGPVFSNLVLADEINRATPRTQAALLEAMAEGTVSADRKTYQLPNPFMVMATQNPVEFSGTFPLPEAQLDRFFMRLSLGYPNEEQEVAMMMAQQQGHPLDALKPLLNETTLLALQAQVDKVTLAEPMARYISQLVRATREQPGVKLGASPRGSLALMQASRALALISGRKAVTPDVIKPLLEPILAHRILFRDAALQRIEGRQEFWQQLLSSVAVPDYASDDKPAAQPDSDAYNNTDHSA
ncbi:AAA family ATPase [Bacterioplanes sanyensis]|uniref:AAA family ATPase n=1 Tax=Bacterioplanes sanyensis TaxID=1249553 RepID=UPI001671BE4E|nr:MoxR family ATPase [Bacterioplanes sanyensis]